ncbi:MAG: hypothetical protein HOK80_09140 [Candidatus Cloacimonetes bacterium]|nr:hypothetical protein [Candidatus Cloacimonadota bacterium]
MGYCKDCGEICSNCQKRTSEYTLFSLDEKIRKKVSEFLIRVKATQHDQDWLCSRLSNYPINIIEQALRSWSNSIYSESQMNVNYFFAIVKRLSKAKKIKLQSLPPYVDKEET